MKNNIRLQWLTLFTVFAAFFVGVLMVGARNRARDIYLGAYPSQTRAVGAALSALANGTVKFPYAAVITVHFRGPHPLPAKREEAFSFNRRLGVLLIYTNRSNGTKPVRWNLTRIACNETDRDKIKALALKPALLLDKPQDCGCEVQPLMEIGGVDTSKESAADRHNQESGAGP